MRLMLFFLFFDGCFVSFATMVETITVYNERMGLILCKHCLNTAPLMCAMYFNIPSANLKAMPNSDFLILAS